VGGSIKTGALLGALSGTAGLAQAKLINTAGDAAGRAAYAAYKKASK